VRSLSIRLVEAVRKWKSSIKRATATFTVFDANEGLGLGKVMTGAMQVEKSQQIACLYSSQNYKRRASSKVENKQESTGSDKCVMCSVFHDKQLQRNCSLLLNKLKFFVGDFVVFRPRTDAQIK